MSTPAFASVERPQPNILCITVHAPSPTDEQFAALVDDARRLYVAMPVGFVLVFDLSLMGMVDPRHARAWMALFEEMLPVTRARLLCTLVVITNPLVRLGVDLFLALYDPIRPLRVFDGRAACMLAARRATEDHTLTAE